MVPGRSARAHRPSCMGHGFQRHAHLARSSKRGAIPVNFDDSSELEDAVAAAINAAEEVSEQQVEATQKPRLLVEPASPDRTVASLRDILAQTQIYERGAPVRIVRDQTIGGVVAQPITPEGLVLLAHQTCRPHE